MILEISTIKENLNNLDNFLESYPIFRDLQDGRVLESSLYGIGFDSVISFMKFKRESEKNGMHLLYDRRVSYLEVKRKIVELNSNLDSSRIFSNKSEKSFIGMWKDFKIVNRYTKHRNKSFACGLKNAFPIIYNYLSQNKIDVDYYIKSFGNLDFGYYTMKFQMPSLYSREMNMTKNLVQEFIKYVKNDDLDLRKCNIKTLTSELKSELVKIAIVDPGSQLKCISDYSGITVNNHYKNIKSQVNNNGFVDVQIINDSGKEIWCPYSVFEEVSRNRQDILKNLGI